MVVVGEDGDFGGPGWRSVGTVVPASVAPGATERIVITLPSSGSWAVFVNPGPARGALLTTGDIPADFSGELPGIIMVNSNGEPTFNSAKDLPPGWCAEGSPMGCR